MPTFTFICKESDGSWAAERYTSKDDQEKLSAEAASTSELQSTLRNLALSSGGAGAVQTSFSFITPQSAIFQVLRLL